jgi:hypothetical protein
MEILQKSKNIKLSSDPVIPLSGIYWKVSKLTYNRDTCTLMFISALFTIIKLWNSLVESA